MCPKSEVAFFLCSALAMIAQMVDYGDVLLAHWREDEQSDVKVEFNEFSNVYQIVLFQYVNHD